jgi:hypothetical protein
MKTKFLVRAAVALGVLAASTSAVRADVVWKFDRPSTSDQKGAPYPVIATLTLKDMIGDDGAYVLFTLDPDETNPGYSQDAKKPSTINDLSFVFSSGIGDLPPSAYEYVSGEKAATFVGDIDDQNLASGYKTSDGSGTVQLTWPSKNNDPNKFLVTETSVWKIKGTTIAANFSALAYTTSNKPEPIFGVISVDPFSNKDKQPNSSNWVTNATVAPPATPSTVVPIPAALWLFGSALVGIAGIGCRRSRVA